MPTGEIQSLLNRQEAILSDLAQVKAEVEGLATKLGVSLPDVRVSLCCSNLSITDTFFIGKIYFLKSKSILDNSRVCGN